MKETARQVTFRASGEMLDWKYIIGDSHASTCKGLWPNTAFGAMALVMK